MKALICFLIILFLHPFRIDGARPTMRCMAGPKSVKGTVKQSAAVFSGEVLAVKSGVNFLEARFRVERFWKGAVSEEVSVWTDGTAESPHYRVGEKYLVFAGTQNGKLFTGICSRTKRLEYAQSDLEQLGEGQSPRAER
jgi:hypothetical protein